MDIWIQICLRRVLSVCLAEGSIQDYHRLSGFHHRDGRRVPPVQKAFVLKRGDAVCGVILYKYPGLACQGRREAFGRVLTTQELNRDLTTIARVVVHPKYRTIGLGTKLVKETLPPAGKPYVEMIAVMAKYNPFAEKAGMRKILESKLNPAVLEAIEKLRKLGFNPVFLSSEKYNMHQLRALRAVSQVKTILKDLSKAVGIYRKRLLSGQKAYYTHKEFSKYVEGADLKKLGKMLRILGFLTQTKVYLFWKNISLSALGLAVLPFSHRYGLSSINSSRSKVSAGSHFLVLLISQSTILFPSPYSRGFELLKEGGGVISQLFLKPKPINSKIGG